MFFLTVFAALILRVFLIWPNSVAFASDMGRDLLWTKDIAFYHTPTLIGPAASIWGVYFQPFWYYFLSLPLLITNGNPVSAVYATSFAIIGTGILGYLFFRNQLGKINAFIFAIAVMFCGELVNISTFAFHANMLPVLTLLVIYFCFLAVIKNTYFLVFSALFSSLMFSADPAPAVVIFPLPILVFLIFKLYKRPEKIKTFIFYVFSYTLPFTPQIIFELRNNFIETHSLINYFLGKNPSLSGHLPFFQRIPDRTLLLLNFLQNNFAGQSTVVAVVLLTFILIGNYLFIKNNKNQKISVLYKINIIALLTTIFIYTFLITVEIKNWYLEGLTVNIVFLITFAVMGSKLKKRLVPIFLTIYLMINLSPFLKTSRLEQLKNDPALLSNQLTAINQIYQDKEKQFSVYVYTPSIYDLNYQYLFWWQGIRQKRGLPDDFAYLPYKPSYVRNKDVYFQAKNTDVIYLIIENAAENEFYTSKSWKTNFNDYKIAWSRKINEAIILEKRIKQQ